MIARRTVVITLRAPVSIYDPPCEMGVVTCSRTDDGRWSTPEFRTAWALSERDWEMTKPAVEAAFAAVRAAIVEEPK